MKLKKRICAVVACVALFFSAIPPLTTHAADTTITTNIDDATLQEYADEVVARVNEERAKDGLDPLYAVPVLCDMAADRAAECVEYYSHTRPDGRSCFTIFDDYGVRYWAAGENIAYGFTSSETVIDGWMNSTGHRANILDEEFNYIGVGVSYDATTKRYYWTQLFLYSREDLAGKYLPSMHDVEKGTHTTTDVDTTNAVTKTITPNVEKLSSSSYNYYSFTLEPGDALAMDLNYTISNIGSGGAISFGTIIADAVSNHSVKLDSDGAQSTFYTFHSENSVTVQFKVPITTTVDTISCTMYYDEDKLPQEPDTDDDTAWPYQITVSMPYVGNLYVGDTFPMEYEVVNYDGDITWYSTNSHVATVTQDGYVHVVGEGEVTIAAVDDYGIHHAVTFTTFHIEVHETTDNTTYVMGDVDRDGMVSAIDAHLILVEYAGNQVGVASTFDAEQTALADVDGDGTISAIDSYYVLVYYALSNVHENVTWNDVLN